MILNLLIKSSLKFAAKRMSLRRRESDKVATRSQHLLVRGRRRDQSVKIFEKLFKIMDW